MFQLEKRIFNILEVRKIFIDCKCSRNHKLEIIMSYQLGKGLNLLNLLNQLNQFNLFGIDSIFSLL